MDPANHQQAMYLSGRTDRVQQLAHVSLTDGAWNTAVGLNAGTRLAARGRRNTVVGAEAGTVLTGNNNALVGAYAGERASGVSDSVAVGHGAGRAMGNVASCVLVGAGAGAAMQKASFNTAVGFASAGAMVSGARNVFVGSFTGYYVRNASDNVFVGHAVGKSTRHGDGNVFMGSSAAAGGAMNRSLVVGAGAAAAAAGDDNVFLGFECGGNVTASQLNTVVGARAGQSMAGGNNVVVGATAALEATVSSSVAVGNRAMQTAAGAHNVAVGDGAGVALYGDRNTAIGSEACASLQGSNNVFVGDGAGQQCEAGDSVGVGKGALQQGVGVKNVAVGTQAATAVVGSRNTVVGTDACVSLTGNKNVVVGTNLLPSLSALENSIVIGNNIDSSDTVPSLLNAVIIGQDVVIGTRDSESLVLSSSSVGDVVRASGNTVTFGAGILVKQTTNVFVGPRSTNIQRVTGNAFDTPLTFNTPVWYNYMSPPNDGFYGPREGSLLGANGFFLFPTLAYQALLMPENPNDHQYFGQTNHWRRIDLPFNVYVEGVAYTRAYLHPGGMLTLWNDTLALPVPTLYDQDGGITTWSGPVLYFQPGGYSFEAVWRFHSIDYERDHIRTIPSNTYLALGHTELRGFIIRYEGRHLATGTYLVAEITLFSYLSNTNTVQADNSIIRVSWGPSSWPGAQYPLIILLGPGGPGGKLLSKTVTEGNNVAYLIPTHVSFVSPWQSVRVSPLASPLALFGGTFDSVYVSTDGQVDLGSNGARSTTSLRVGYSSDYSYYRSTRQASCAMVQTQVSGNTLLRLELVAQDTGDLYVVELLFRATAITIAYSGLLTNAAYDGLFGVVVKGALHPVPRRADRSYEITSDPREYVFAGSGARINSGGISLLEPGVFSGSGEFGNVVVSGLVTSSKRDILTGFAGGPFITQGPWDEPSQTHVIPWSALGNGCENVSGMMYVHASSKDINEKNGMATVSVIKGLTGNISAVVLSNHKSPGLATFTVTASGNTVVVNTGPGCAVCWTFIAAC